jgi:putative membrane protein
MHMRVGSWWFLGMHVFWWVLLAALLVWAYRFAMSRLNRPTSDGREMPLEVLQRRYATGELTTQQFEERRARLEGSTVPSSAGGTL